MVASKYRSLYVFTNSYKPILGGIQTVTSQFAEESVARGIKTVVVTNLYPRGLRIFERISGVPVVRLPFAVPTGRPIDFLRYVISLCALFVMFLLRRPSCVYVHFPLSQASCVAALRKVFGFKLVCCFHGHDVLRYDEGWPTDSAQYRAQKRLVELSDSVTACSNFLAGKVCEIFGCNNAVAVYNGVNLGRFEIGAEHSGSRHPYMFAWGRLEKIKGFDILIRAFAESRGASVMKLLIAGDGTQKESLQQLIAELGMQKRVELIGRLSQDDVAHYAKNSTINIISSLKESFGIVALEAIAAGRPIISTDGGGLPEIMDDRFGVTVSADAGRLRDAIDDVMAGKYDFDFSEAAEYLKQFTVERMVDKYLSFSE